MTIRVLALMLGLAVILPAQERHVVEGIPGSPVRVKIYEDLQCSDCADFRRMMDEKILPRYAGKVTFEHYDFPLAKHAWARKAAIASRFFLTQSNDLAVQYRQAALKSQAQIHPENFNEWLAEFAKAHGVDPAKAIGALDDPTFAAQVEEDFQDGVARGMAHTPTVLVNGKPFIEVFPYEDVAKAIDSELASAK
jgi:protein-disulfide isomerase